MSPPEVWGPAVWRLFHTLAATIHRDAFPRLSRLLYNHTAQICRYLPCPECAQHSTQLIARIAPHTLKTPQDWQHALYLLHNCVNVRKHKPLFLSTRLLTYQHLPLSPVLASFLQHYHTKGNMKLLTESFQRSLVTKQLVAFVYGNAAAFWCPKVPKVPKGEEPEEVGI